MLELIEKHPSPRLTSCPCPQLTGAGGGLGRLFALGLARRGCRLACVDVATKPNEATAAAVVRETGAEARAYTADLSKSDDIAALVKTVIADFGHVDILVSNAGQLQGGLMWEVPDDALDLILDVNLRATILLVRALLPHMRERASGHIVAISSVAGEADAPFVSMYAATKAGLTRFMGCLYHDLYRAGLHKDILVTTVKPYFMATYQQLVDCFTYNKIGKILVPFMDPEVAAETILEAIARGDQVVTVPTHFSLVLHIVRLLPLSLVALVVDKVLGAEVRPLISYAKRRHQELDADLLHELLSKEYTLAADQDPEPVCRALLEERAAGRPTHHDFAPLADGVLDYYRKQAKPVPEAVRTVFSLS
ncbi:Protein dhs-3 [Frankliniella fusca]|uniref:Protein dhs-3 n=1 Tax=Frankliniella fusca TaxID=407009 RepID=A0AAE1GQD2_9NEOP|nr:Protein dhs-3 [Frankliniella fusca]